MKQTTSPTPKLTPKQKKFVEGYIEKGNGTQAALEAYDTTSEEVAAVIAHENLRKPNIQAALEEALPTELLVQVHREGLFASRTVFSKDGEPLGEDTDFNVRAKYLDMAYKLKGSYAPEKRASVHIHVEPNPRIKELAKKLNK